MDYSALDADEQVQGWANIFAAHLSVAFKKTNPSSDEQLLFAVNDSLSAADYLIHRARLEIEGDIEKQQQQDTLYAPLTNDQKAVSEHKYTEWQNLIFKLRVIHSDIYAIQRMQVKLAKME